MGDPDSGVILSAWFSQSPNHRHCHIFAAHILAIRFLAAQGADSPPSALSKQYTNVAYGLALKMPADFSAYPPVASLVRDETGAPTGEAILLRNTFVDRGEAALQYGPVIRSD